MKPKYKVTVVENNTKAVRHLYMDNPVLKALVLRDLGGPMYTTLPLLLERKFTTDESRNHKL